MTDNPEMTMAAPDPKSLISNQLDALHARLAEAESTTAKLAEAADRQRETETRLISAELRLKETEARLTAAEKAADAAVMKLAETEAALREVEAGLPTSGAISPKLAEGEAAIARLAEVETAAANARDQQLRAVAELDNVRKRAEREIANSLKFGSERVLGDLLPITDSLELGLKAATAPDAAAKAIAEGLDLTHKQLLGFFEKYGVSVVDPVGQPFNPALHEAVSAVPSTDVAPNHVLAVMQKGYRLHERLLRPAMVVVAKAPQS